MTTVNITRTTNLRGRQLQDAVANMIQELTGRSPYSLVRLSWRWVTGSEIDLSAGNHIRGTVTIQDGSPSRVTARIELMSGLARGQHANIIRDVNALADQRLGGAPSAPGAPPGEPQEPSSYEAPRERQRREYDPERAAAITTGIFGGLTALARGISAGFEQQPAAPGKPPTTVQQPQPTTTAAPAPAAKPGVIEAVTSLITGKPAPAQPPARPRAQAEPMPREPQPTYAPQPAEAPAPARTPWGWIALGVGAAAATTVAVVVLSGSDEK